MNPHANLLLVCATKVESKAILDVFQSASNKPSEPMSIANRMYHNLGLINNTTVFMMQCEMGSVGLGSSLMTVSKGINALLPDAVIMVGIAFGVNKKRQLIGEVLVSQQLMLYELQRVGTMKDNTQPLVIPRGDRPHASPWLLDRFRNSEAYWDDRFRVSFGLILSGEKLVDNVDFREQLKQFEPEAIGGEMEGAGLYTACQDANADWILVKAICDWADGNKKRNKGENQRVAAHNAATFVLHVLQQAPLKKEGDNISPFTSSVRSTEKTKPAQVTILLNKDIHDFTPFEQDSFIIELSRIVKVDPDQIRILRVVSGSTIITVEMPEEASEVLHSLYLQQDLRLQKLQIRKIEVANPDQLALLKEGIDTWNSWRKQNLGTKIVLTQARLSGLDLRKAMLNEGDLRWASLMGADLKGANLSNIDLRGANLSEADLSETNLVSASLLEIDLSRTNLRNTDLRWANLSDAKLREADLSGANLDGATLSRADLRGATLRRASLKGAVLDGSNLSGAKFGKTVLAFTDLSNVLGLEQVEHFGPSSIGLETIIRSKGKIPEEFFRVSGLSDIEIEAIKIFNPDLPKDDINKIPNKISDLRAYQALQISPLFISYSHADAAFVDKLENYLKTKGIRFWRDVRDATAGRLTKQIDQALRLNPTVLLILSEHSIRSDWVEHEVRTARQLEKEMGRDVLCPVALDDSWKSSSWPTRVMEQIMEYNILDFSEWKDDSKFGDTFRRLIDGLELFYKG